MTSPGELTASSPPVPAIGKLLTRFRYAVATADQLAISALNFGLTFALLHALSAPEFGVVVLWMAAATLPIMAQSALVLTPLSVYAPAEADEAKRRRLEEALGSANLLLLVGSVVVVLAVNLTINADWVPLGWVAWGAIPAYVGMAMYREYYRFFSYSRRDMRLLLAVDVPYLTVTVACVAAILMWPEQLATLGGAFTALTLGAMAGQFCGGIYLRRRRLHLLRSGWARPYRAIFGEVAWSLSGVLGGHLQERSYVYITTSLVGLAQLAALNAAAVLFRPATILLTAWRRSKMPEFSELFAAGRLDAVYRHLVAASAVALLGCATWSALLFFGWRLVAHYLLADKYPDAHALLLPWAIAFSLEAVRFIVSTALQAARDFRYISWVTVVTALLTLACTAALTVWFGYVWAIYGLAIGNGLGTLMLAARLRLVRRRMIAPVDGAAVPG